MGKTKKTVLKKLGVSSKRKIKYLKLFEMTPGFLGMFFFVL